MRSLLLVLLVLLPYSLFAIQKDSTLSISTASGSVFGTLTLPSAKTPVPLVLVIAGSGPTDRNGNQGKMKNNSLLALGDSLAKRGIATLRYDKRGVGASKEAAPEESALRFDDYIDDAAVWVRKLQQDKRFSRIYILGHSEGSLIGMLAAQRVPAAGLISIAGPAQPADSIIFKQLTASPMISAGMVDTVRLLFARLRNGEQIAQVPDGFYQALLRPSVQPYVRSWIKYNPSEEIAKVKMPVLIIQGTTDIQVDTVEAHALAKAKSGSKLVIIKNMNHVLKNLSSREPMDNQLSYTDPGFFLSRELVPAIAGFVLPAPAKKK
jgi:alpha-beta hydrolase superfamily lysophospholipase